MKKYNANFYPYILRQIIQIFKIYRCKRGKFLPKGTRTGHIECFDNFEVNIAKVFLKRQIMTADGFRVSNGCE